MIKERNDYSRSAERNAVIGIRNYKLLEEAEAAIDAMLKLKGEYSETMAREVLRKIRRALAGGIDE